VSALSPAGYHLGATVFGRLYNLLVAVIWAGVAAAAASGALFTATALTAAATDVARDPSLYAAVTPSQTYALLFLTIFALLATVGFAALAWHRLAAMVRPVSGSVEQAPAGSRIVTDDEMPTGAVSRSAGYGGSRP
jgi:hypothetical protein